MPINEKLIREETQINIKALQNQEIDYETFRATYKREFNCLRNRNTLCYNSSYHQYKDYGGRGIKLCTRWTGITKQSLINFLEDKGIIPDGMEIDRIDNDGDYTPENTHWVSRKDNTRNRRTARIITFNDKSKSLVEWCEELNLFYTTIVMRLKNGWDTDKALATPTGRTFAEYKAMRGFVY